MASGFRMYPSQAPPQESRFRPQPPPSSGSRFFPSGTFKRAGGGGGTYRSSTLLHKGKCFYDLLSVLKPEPALDPLVSASPLAGPRYEDHPRPGSGPRSPTLPTPRGGVNTMPGSMPRGAVLAGGGGEGAVGGGERGTGGRGPNAAMLDCPLPPGFGGERIEFSSTASRSSPAAVKGEKKVISKDMIGRPTQFVHVLHASDADQAQEMLMRFAAEGVGKMPDENWAKTIKGIITARAKQRQALAIAEVQDAIHRESYNAYNGPLHVTNGLPSSAGYPSTIRSPLSTPTNEKTLSIMTQATIGHPSTVKQSSPLRGPNSPASSPLSSGAPPFPATALQRKPSPPELLRADTAQTVVVRPLPEVPTTPTPTPASIPGMPGTSTAPSTPISKTNGEAPPAFPPRPIVPTMETLERAASAAIFFETLYHGLLKSAVSHQNPHQTRERRRRALERDLERRPDLTEAERREARERLRFEETAWLREKRKKVGVKEFSKVKVIGHGAFGVVSLVRERETNALYAMKQLRKGDMLRKGQEGHVRSERDLLAAAASEGTSDASWIVKLHYSFQDADHLYLVLDYMGGGDLLNLLVEKDIFPEDFTRFYIAEMVLSLEACHKLGYIHRDIKPDNFLIGPDGHLCVSDFGLATDLHWAHDTTYYEQQRRDLLKRHGIDLEEPSSVGGRAAKKLDRKTAEQIMGGEEGLLTWRDKNRKKLAYSVAGTNSYMAPEVIRGLGYGFSCDWWSLGVIMYECLYGYPPFVSQSRQATRQKILNWQSSLRFPPRPRVSREAIDLMTALLCEPSDRIGSNFEPQRPNSHIIQERRSGFLPPPAGALSGDGADQIKAHPWFKGIDFSTIHLERAPYQPEMRDPADTRHFDEDIPDEPLAPAGGGAPDATKDPVLKHRVHGAHVLDIRKQKAFAGFTYKAPRPISRGAIPTGLGGPSSSDELTEPSMLASSTTQQQAFPAILFRPDVAPAATAAVGAAAFSGTVRGRALSL